MAIINTGTACKNEQGRVFFRYVNIHLSSVRLVETVVHLQYTVVGGARNFSGVICWAYRVNVFKFLYNIATSSPASEIDVWFELELTCISTGPIRVYVGATLFG